VINFSRVSSSDNIDNSDNSDHSDSDEKKKNSNTSLASPPQLVYVDIKHEYCVDVVVAAPHQSDIIQSTRFDSWFVPHC